MEISDHIFTINLKLEMKILHYKFSSMLLIPGPDLKRHVTNSGAPYSECKRLKKNESRFLIECFYENRRTFIFRGERKRQREHETLSIRILKLILKILEFQPSRDILVFMVCEDVKTVFIKKLNLKHEWSEINSNLSLALTLSPRLYAGCLAPPSPVSQSQSPKDPQRPPGEGLSLSLSGLDPLNPQLVYLLIVIDGGWTLLSLSLSNSVVLSNIYNCAICASFRWRWRPVRQECSGECSGLVVARQSGSYPGARCPVPGAQGRESGWCRLLTTGCLAWPGWVCLDAPSLGITGGLFEVGSHHGPTICKDEDLEAELAAPEHELCDDKEKDYCLPYNPEETNQHSHWADLVWLSSGLCQLRGDQEAGTAEAGYSNNTNVQQRNHSHSCCWLEEVSETDLTHVLGQIESLCISVTIICHSSQYLRKLITGRIQGE